MSDTGTIHALCFVNDALYASSPPLPSIEAAWEAIRELAPALKASLSEAGFAAVAEGYVPVKGSA